MIKACWLSKLTAYAALLLLLNIKHCIYYCEGISVTSEIQLYLFPAFLIYFKAAVRGWGAGKERKRESKSIQRK